MQGDELASLGKDPSVEMGPTEEAGPHAKASGGARQTRRRVYYLVYGLLAAGATLLNWCLMHSAGYSMPALAVLTSTIAWVFLLGTLLPFGYRSLLDADVMEVGNRPMAARLVLTSVLSLSLGLGLLTCWLLGMPLIIPFTPQVE